MRPLILGALSALAPTVFGGVSPSNIRRATLGNALTYHASGTSTTYSMNVTDCPDWIKQQYLGTWH